MQHKAGRHRRYKVYTNPDLHAGRSPWLAWGARLVIALALLLILGALGKPVYSLLVSHGGAAR